MRLLVLDSRKPVICSVLRWPSRHSVGYLLAAFKIRSTESIVFQLRVVAGAPKSSSIWPRYPIVFMWRRYTPNTTRFLDPMIRTNHSSPPGNAIGGEALPRPAFDRMLTNRTTSGRDGSAPNGFSISNPIRSLASQNATSASNGSFRRSSARNLLREPGFERQVLLQRRRSRHHRRPRL